MFSIELLTHNVGQGGGRNDRRRSLKRYAVERNEGLNRGILRDFAIQSQFKLVQFPFQIKFGTFFVSLQNQVCCSLEI